MLPDFKDILIDTKNSAQGKMGTTYRVNANVYLEGESISEIRMKGNTEKEIPGQAVVAHTLNPST